MAAVKPYFYKLREDMPELCEGVDIPRYLEKLRVEFGHAALHDIDPAAKLPGGPVFYSDAPRTCQEGPKKYELEDAISDCLRRLDKKGEAKRALAELIADKIMDVPDLRERMVSWGRVPQSWAPMLTPADPQEKPDRDKIFQALATIEDRDYSTRTNAKGARHPLARILETDIFTYEDKMFFVADYVIGLKRPGEAPRAVRIGSRGNYTELTKARFLEANGALVLETVGDVLHLSEHFTATNRLKRTAAPKLKTLSPGDLAPRL